ncbi:MAG: methionyl-tRNA formyltransferase [Planctomycetes bacterium]|nr:methionyl-tRNA formyltransferase [Planctomycetota bacterium]
MRVFFAGSPPFATPIFGALLDSAHTIVGLLTPPEKPKGRGLKVEVSPLAAMATKKGVEVYHTSNVNDPEVLDRIRKSGADALVVASFGQLLKDELLNSTPRGALNVHASLLPRFRGASPVAFAILEGDAETGVSIQRMVRKLDAGPVAASAKTTISNRETAGELTDRLANIGGALLIQVLDQMEKGTARFEPQDESKVTIAKKLKKEDGRIDWNQPSIQIARRIRAMTPWPGAQTMLIASESAGDEGISLRILDAEVKEIVGGHAKPGTISALPSDPHGKQPDFLDVATLNGVLTIHRLQPEGGRALNAAEFLRGRRWIAGAKLQ